jgi:hypothetical protein
MAEAGARVTGIMHLTGAVTFPSQLTIDQGNPVGITFIILSIASNV